MEKLEFQKAKGFLDLIWDIALLLIVQVDEQLIKAIMPIWDHSYTCFTFNQEDMTLIIEKYTALLKIVTSNLNKFFWKKTKRVGFVKKMLRIMGIDAKIIG